MDDRFVGETDAVPAPVAIHAVVATGDRPDPSARPEPALNLRDEAGRRVGEGVTAVGEGVQDEVLHFLTACQLDQSPDVLPSRVNAAIRYQSDQM